MAEMLDVALSCGRKEVTLHLFNDSFSSCLNSSIEDEELCPQNINLTVISPVKEEVVPQAVQHVK